MELRSALAAKFEIELPATAVFDYPTVAALVGFIARTLADADSDSEWLSDGSEYCPVGALLPGTTSASTDADLITDLVGVGCIYPGASPTAAATSSARFGGFWAPAADGASLQRPVPYQRWDLDWSYSTDAAPGHSYARFAAFAEVGFVCWDRLCLR